MTAQEALLESFEKILVAAGMPAELPSLLNADVEQLPEQPSTELERAGVDPGTDSEVFIKMNGRNIFVTGELCDSEKNHGCLLQSDSNLMNVDTTITKTAEEEEL